MILHVASILDVTTLHVTTVFLLRPNVCPVSFGLWFLQRSKKSRPRRSSPDGRFHRPLVTRRVSVWNLRMSGLARRQKWPPGEFEARIPQPWTRIISRFGSQDQNTGFHQTPAWIYLEHHGTHVHRRTIWILAIGHALLEMLMSPGSLYGDVEQLLALSTAGCPWSEIRHPDEIFKVYFNSWEVI